MSKTFACLSSHSGARPRYLPGQGRASTATTARLSSMAQLGPPATHSTKQGGGPMITLNTAIAPGEALCTCCT